MFNITAFNIETSRRTRGSHRKTLARRTSTTIGGARLSCMRDANDRRRPVEASFSERTQTRGRYDIRESRHTPADCFGRGSRRYSRGICETDTKLSDIRRIFQLVPDIIGARLSPTLHFISFITGRPFSARDTARTLLPRDFILR